MKKNYLIALSVFAISQANAQVTLTKANSEPIIGETYKTKQIDTTTTLPMNISGAGVTWNVTGISESGVVDTTKYVAPSADPNSANFPGTTLVEYKGTNKTYFKATATQYELLGLDAGTFMLNYSGNSAIVAVYPISMGYINNDTGSGAMTANANNGTFTSTIVTKGDATGTLNLNGSVTFSNCLRVKTTQNINFTLSGAPGTSNQVLYKFYHSSSKWPIFTVDHTVVSIPLANFNQNRDKVSTLSSIVLGVNESTINDIIFKAYPNPTHGDVTIHFVLTQNESYTITILNNLGQVVKIFNKANLTPGVYSETIDAKDLSAGIYTVKVNGTRAQGTQKIIVE